MNLLEHYIIKVISKEDVTEKYQKHIHHQLYQKILKVTCLVDCYGIKEEQTHYWLESDWNRYEKQGFYMA